MYIVVISTQIMKKRILSVLSKAPMRKGRVGPMHKQDWHATCVLLARELERDKHAMALLVTALELDGEDEMIHYHGTLRKLGICEKRILCVKEGFETMHQLKRSAEEAERHEAELTIVLVAVHLPRTKLLCRALDIKAKFQIGRASCRG